MELKYKGTLEFYFETGLGAMLQLYLDGHDIPNPKFDELDPKMGPKFFHDWSGVISLDKGDRVTIISSPYKKFNKKTFTMGNLRWAARDGYRFGANYPFEEDQVTLKEWYELFACEKTVAKVTKTVKTIALYGGTFDPIHNGHKSIIDLLQYKYDLVLIMPGNNWTKENPPIFPLDQRINAIKAVAKNMHNVRVLDWAKKQNTTSTYKMVEKIKKQFGVEPHIVVGADNIEKIESWKFWDKLKKMQFVVFDRKTNEVVSLDKFEKTPFFWPQSKPDHLDTRSMSSTKIRETRDVSNVPKEALSSLDLTLLSQNDTDMIKK